MDGHDFSHNIGSGRVEGWRGTSISSPSLIKRRMRSSRITLTRRLLIKGYVKYRAGSAFTVEDIASVDPVEVTSMTIVNRRIRSWHIQLKSDKTLLDFSRIFDPILRGWHAYFGRFYPSALGKIWDHFNRYLVRWVRRKFKRFRRHKRRARRYLARFARAHRDWFIHCVLEYCREVE